jgi:transposase
MDEITVEAKYRSLAPVLTERSRRLWAATEARALGHGGIALVERATGISRSTIQRGIRELDSGETLLVGTDRVRRAGAGRPPAVVKDPSLFEDLDALIEPTASGDPDSPLRWTTKSVRSLADALRDMGHAVSHTVVAELLHELGYSLAGESEAAPRHQPSGSGRAISLHQRPGPPVREEGSAGDLGGHEEEGTRRGLQESRSLVETEGKSRAGAGP